VCDSEEQRFKAAKVWIFSFCWPCDKSFYIPIILYLDLSKLNIQELWKGDRLIAPYEVRGGGWSI